jgi:glycerol-3-phosphate dehydrogenase
LLNIFGGKITTFRRLSEHMLEKIEDQLGKRGRPWTAAGTLPGGDFAATAFDAELQKLKADYPFLDPRHAHRLFRLYGTKARTLLGKAASVADLGRHFGSDLYEAEVRYQIEHEWAVTAQDVLWRRTKKGLHLSADEAAALDRFMENAVDRRRQIAAE